jgi:hypothetical protein
MNIKKMPFLIFLIAGIILWPIKFVFSFTNNKMEYNIVFGFICLAVLAIIIISCFYFDNGNFGNEFKSDLTLGTLCSGISASFIWCALSFLKDHAPEDIQGQYFIMFLLSCTVAISFFIISISHFTGKNKFKSMQLFIFAPAIYFLFSLTLFLSFDAGTPNPYNIIAQSFLALFFIYFTQFFLKCTKKINIEKRLLALGLPSVLAAVSFTVPALFSNPSANSVLTSTSVAHTLVAFYIITFLFKKVNVFKILSRRDL